MIVTLASRSNNWSAPQVRARGPSGAGTAPVWHILLVCQWPGNPQKGHMTPPGTAALQSGAGNAGTAAGRPSGVLVPRGRWRLTLVWPCVAALFSLLLDPRLITWIVSPSCPSRGFGHGPSTTLGRAQAADAARPRCTAQRPARSSGALGPSPGTSRFPFPTSCLPLLRSGTHSAQRTRQTSP